MVDAQVQPISSSNQGSNKQGMFAFKPNQEYKVEHLSEGFFGVLFLGASSINPKKLEASLNKHSAQGYYVAQIFTEKRRKFIFWNVDSAIIVYGKDR